jgi:parallel beta-helix repeat protein
MASNGVMGLHIDQTHNVRVENNLLAFNNTTLSNIPATGGLKATVATNLMIKNNAFSGNRGSRGLWLDISSNNSVIAGNDFYNNDVDGLFLEVSDVAHVYQNGRLLDRECRSRPDQCNGRPGRADPS